MRFPRLQRWLATPTYLRAVISAVDCPHCAAVVSISQWKPGTHATLRCPTCLEPFDVIAGEKHTAEVKKR